MKKKLYLLVCILSLFACKKYREGREPTTFVGPQTISNPGPPYIPPPCSPLMSTTESPLANFQLTFSGTPTVVNSNNTLIIKSSTNQADRVEILLYPFFAGQSTVYYIRDSRNIRDYEGYIEFYANKFDPDPNTKVHLTSFNLGGNLIYVKYNSSTKKHELVFCSSSFNYLLGGNTSQTSISGKLSF
jgi:hypothetical protein